MENLSSDIFIKISEKNIIRFSHNNRMGIYYEIIKDNRIIKRISVIKTSFKYFDVSKDFNGNIYLICQDEIGNIIFLNLINNKWKFRTLFYLKNKNITPIKMKSFFQNKDLKLITNLDSNPKKVYYSDDLKEMNLIYNDENDLSVNYDIVFGEKYNSLLIHAVSFNMFKIIIKSFSKVKKRWNRNKIVYISNRNYIDNSYCEIDNKIHFLIVLEEKNNKSIIYKNINIDSYDMLQKETIIFEHNDISSCLIVEEKKVLWAFWISDNKLFGSFSLNKGEVFSSPIVYKHFNGEYIKKGKLIKEDNRIDVYFYEENGLIYLILDNILNINTEKYNIDYKSISYGIDTNNEKSKNVKEIIKRL